jgi:hypothetical protein
VGSLSKPKILHHIVRWCLVRGVKIFGCHIGCVGRDFWILIKKQITEPVKKLRDKSNDTN